jgi:hypothetical protein
MRRTARWAQSAARGMTMADEEAPGHASDRDPSRTGSGHDSNHEPRRTKHLSLGFLFFSFDQTMVLNLIRGFRGHVK